MRIAKLSLALLFLSQVAFAQIGVQTAKPMTTTPQPSGTAVPANITGATPSDTPAGSSAQSAAVPDCNITIGKLPLKGKSAKEAACFWNEEGQEYLKYARFISSSKSFSASTDMVTDVFGTVRVVFSGAVAATTSGDSGTTALQEGEGGDTSSSDEPTASQDKTANLFKTNGGNLALTASYPLYYKPIGGGQLLWNSYLRLAGNVDAMGGDTEVTVPDSDINGNLELAFSEFQVDLLSYQQNFNLIGYAKGSGVLGTKKFAAALGNGVGTTFLHGQVGAGLRVASKMTIYFSYNWYSDSHIPGNGGAVTLVMGD